MSIEEIRTLKHAKPFQPFDIVMNDGRVLRVALPERLAVSASGQTISVFDGPAADFLEVQRIAALRTHEVGQTHI
jgi:hypothetical protein